MTNSPLATLKISLAYKATVVAMAIVQANEVAQQLNLSLQKPISQSEIKWAFVSPPGLSQPSLPTIAFDTRDFYFSFENGKLHSVDGNAHKEWDMLHYHQWVKMHSLIDTNAAYQLATQWLSSVSVDVSALNRTYSNSMSVGQVQFWGDKGTNLVPLPIYQVKWGEDVGNPRVIVQIFGPTKELMDLTIEDQVFLTRTNLFLTNDVELNNIPDPPRKKLVLPDANQRGPLGKSPSFGAPRLASDPK